MRSKTLSSCCVHLLIQNGSKCDSLMWTLLFCGLIEVWISNLVLEILFEVWEIIVEIWRIVVHVNEIGGVWGVVMVKGKLKIEGRREGKHTNGIFEFCPKKELVMNLIIRNYQVVQNIWTFYCRFLRVIWNSLKYFMNFLVLY